MSKMQRTWTSGLIGLVAVIFVIYFSPTTIYKARGILLATKQVRPPISPNNVTQLPSRPFGGKVMGYINIERHYPAPHSVAHKQISQLAQTLSAGVGANAFVVTLFRIGQVTRTKYVYVFQATAYYTPAVRSVLEIPAE